MLPCGPALYRLGRRIPGHPAHQKRLCDRSWNQRAWPNNRDAKHALPTSRGRECCGYLDTALTRLVPARTTRPASWIACPSLLALREHQYHNLCANTMHCARSSSVRMAPLVGTAVLAAGSGMGQNVRSWVKGQAKTVSIRCRPLILPATKCPKCPGMSQFFEKSISRQLDTSPPSTTRRLGGQGALWDNAAVPGRGLRTSMPSEARPAEHGGRP